MRSINELATEICTLAGHVNAANHRMLLLIAEFDRRKGWNDGSTPTCAHWLNWRCGIGLGAAREKVRVARALETLPGISDSMAHGRVSYSMVREMTRVATADNEAYLLSIAEHGTATQVERLVRKYRRCQEAAELSREARQHESRRIVYFYDDDGSLVANVRLPADVGEKWIKALDLAVEALPDEPPTVDVPPGMPPRRVRWGARRADALGLISETFLAQGALDVRGGDRHQIVVHVAQETLRDRTPGCCELDHGPSIAAETARRLACDASIVELTENEDGEPLNVGRKTRTISAPLRRALHARDKGCRFPGCSNSRWIDAHHIEHWANGGETRPGNLVSLCRYHHRSVHEGGIRIQRLDDGALRFVKPDGDAVERVAPGYVRPAGDWRQLPEGKITNGWRGERLDLGTAIECLQWIAARARDVPDGTSRQS
jgi:hypothetical protein